MRLWSIHPKYLDSKGLVAVWREGLLAQNVLLDRTTGSTNHPQLIRFRHTNHPLPAIASYLQSVADEAECRGYHFNKNKIADLIFDQHIDVTNGQIRYEFEHLLGKLAIRNPVLYQKLKNITDIKLHPLFKLVPGEIEAWEISKKGD